MNEKELLKKLNNLQTIKPDENWKKNYRDVLYSQISAGSTEDFKASNFGAVWDNLMPGKIFNDMVRPVWAMAMACVLILVVGIGGVYASKNSKPGDSLYIAKIVSEKAQLAITFDEKDKAKLGLEFAANRAKEITQVLEEPKESVDKGKKVEKLKQNFKKEISGVKHRLTAIKAAEKQSEEDETQVFGANLGKSGQGMKISEPLKSANDVEKETVEKLDLNSQAAVNATSTAPRADEILEEAEKLFDENNYNESIDKLEEANNAINGKADDAGQVKGESETATSTD